MATNLKDEGVWPAERNPGRLDAEQAHRPLDPAFVETFKSNLLASTAAHGSISHLNDANEHVFRVANSESLMPPYPLGMLSNLPQIPSEDHVAGLVSMFCNTMLPKMRLFNCIPAHAFTNGDVPQFLRFAMATLASVASGGSQLDAENLWLTATNLIAASLEVDNRVARNESLLNSWVMLEAYGALSANMSIWRRTNETHGFVETAAHRLCLSAAEETDAARSQSQSDQISKDSRRAAIPAFVLVDIIRAIHYNLPSTIHILEFLSYPTPMNRCLNQIYTSTVVEACRPTLPVSSDSALIGLIAILSSIHTLSTVFYPLDSRWPIKSEGLRFNNPYLPLSTTNENREIGQRLQTALDLWGIEYLRTSSPETTVLFHFCKMYSVLPSVQYLPALASYPPRIPVSIDKIDHYTRTVENELRDNADASKHAWLILENIGETVPIAPVWLPIAVFNAALVIWRVVKLEAGSGSHGSLRVLKLFKVELESMGWPCCALMAETLENLIAS